MKTIEKTVADFFKLNLEAVTSKSRRETLVKARHIIWYFMHLDGLDFAEIAVFYNVGGTGVRSGVAKCRKQMLSNAGYKNTVATIKAILGARE